MKLSVFTGVLDSFSEFRQQRKMVLMEHREEELVKADLERLIAANCSDCSCSNNSCRTSTNSVQYKRWRTSRKTNDLMYRKLSKEV